ncbi:glycoside hydrolase family 65 protein [Paenibacillus sp. R14(2021)]|uniref:glycoside hydrolase family 65 protein n=1 Tax=Paenibacillus sp. R14(2021) TaxID=2859228 RepID=UPI001C615DDA|nr:glycosyl hydrolase family 65 protein [Paenibacillus sp. R14(2021)]
MLQYGLGIGEDQNWLFSENGFQGELLGKTETIMALGNGYMGLRSSPEESYLKQTRNLFVAGTFNKFDDGEATELPNAADLTEMEIVLGGERLSLESGRVHVYQKSLNLRTGELTREFLWESPKGRKYSCRFLRFVSLDNLHMLGMRMEITPLSGECELRWTSGINGQMTNSGAQHFHEGIKRIYDKEIAQLVQTTTQSNIDFVLHAANRWELDGEPLALKPEMNIGRRKVGMSYSCTVPAASVIAVEKIASVNTSRDAEAMQGEAYSLDMLREKSLQAFRSNFGKGYAALLSDSAARWKAYWDNADITIESEEDGFDQLAVRFAQYHLLIMTPHHDSRYGIGAKGLTGEGYKGHSFWDSEIFILPYFLHTMPSIAKGLLEYRYLGLDGARLKAADNGYEGAMYPWETAFTGKEETPVWGAVNVLTGKATKIWSGFLEQHISADIAFAVVKYAQATGDEAFMDAMGAEMLIEIASFWASRVVWDESRQAYVILNIIGPDEYKEHIDNNAFSNYMAQWAIQATIELCLSYQETKPDIYRRLNETFGIEDRLDQWRKVAARLYLPSPRAGDNLIPQDDTYLTKPSIDIAPYKNSASVQGILRDYSRDQVIGMQVSKQADVVMLLYLLQNRFSNEVKAANLSYYESKTIHDSSLSMAVHSIVASGIGERETAYEFFRQASEIDLGANMKSSDAGIHSASLGGIWKCIVFGFAGIQAENGELSMTPRLPSKWKSLRFPFVWKGTRLQIELTHEQIAIEAESPSPVPIDVRIGHQVYRLEDRLTVSYSSAQGS